MKFKITISILISIGIGFVIGRNYNTWKNQTKPTSNNLVTDSLERLWQENFKLVEIKSTSDEEIQKAYFYSTSSATPQPLIVNLHSWSWDYTQFDSLAVLSKEKNINYIHPDFRGQNWTKNACCSELVLSDLDDAIDFAIKNGKVDTTRIYVIGRSGGGYATLALFMKSKHKIKKFSAWVPLTNLVAWYNETKMRKLYYADNILICTNSLDGKLNLGVARNKSPYFWLTPVEKLNSCVLDIYVGGYDGLEGVGPIPITHSINFYNKVLHELKVADSSRYISNLEKLKLLEDRMPLGNFGKIGGREIFLRKEYNNLRITVFEGGHEMLTQYAFDELLK